MARRSAKVTPGGAENRGATKNAPGKSHNPVEQLNMLRSFVSGGGTTWTETELTDCLRQCGYDVERAAERLITGQYLSSRSTVGRKNGKSAFVDVETSVHSCSRENETISCTKNNDRAASVKKASRRRMSVPTKSGPRKAPKVTPTDKSSCVVEGHPFLGPRWLLCQRWLSDAICTTKNGRVEYRERLSFEHSLTGHPVVRFRGANMDGRLPENLSAMLTPLMRITLPKDERRDPAASKNERKLIALSGEALMEDQRLPIGAQVPISLTVYIQDPRAFFELFDAKNDPTKAATTTDTSMFFANKERKNRRGRTLTEATFNLLQWAEYGDVQFQPPDQEKVDCPDSETKCDEESAESSPSEDDQGDDDGVEMAEDDFEEASVDGSTAEAKEWERSVSASSDDWTRSLPEAKDPLGFQDGIALRPYQRQALFWMMQRERKGESREELEKQLALLSELSSSASQKKSQPSFSSASKGIVCDCGPVLVSEDAKKRSRTVAGEVDPMNHPLWKRRFLASESMDESISFYVNELLGVASHQPPDPPAPCSGGVLADSMGLGKTVMLLALIMKAKEERAAAETESPTREVLSTTRTATLVVAKLSLLPQWEDELKSKTSLTYHIFYGQASGRGPSVADLEGVDVVVTTYGTVQGEMKRRNPVLAKCKWLRIILDEAHCIRNQKTIASKVCCNLNAEHRWCVSGTIIQNSLDDVFGIMKFLKHEPWCFPSFWKAAITKPMSGHAIGTASGGGKETTAQGSGPGRAAAATDNGEEGLKTALDRVRRVLAPLMIRRTKDSVTADGRPILTLPEVETKIVKVDFTESEKEFYNAVQKRSQDLFDGFLKSGTATKSYFQIFSLLQRLRQVCDHIVLTVRSRIEDENPGREESNQGEEDDEVAPMSPKKQSGKNDGINRDFLDGLLRKFCAGQSPQKKIHPRRSNDEETGSPSKRLKDQAYLNQVAHTLSDAVEENSSHVNDECPICLECPKIHEAVLTPCAHIFCRDCLVGFLREKVKEGKQRNIGSLLQCPDGECPCCNKTISADRIIALSKSGQDGKTVTTFLTQTEPSVAPAFKGELQNHKEGHPHTVARQILENAVNGAESSKITAIMEELDSVWKLDPGSKVLIFSQYLGFLDLMETQFRSNGIKFFRLDGSLTLKERMAVLEQFRESSRQHPKSKALTSDQRSDNKGTVLLMSMSAGGEGLNLVAASSCFIVDPWWNAAKEDQCVNRIHRIGQTAPLVRVRKFVVNDSVEERIVELQSRKKYVADEIYSDAGRSGDMGSARLSLEEFKLIFQK